MLGTVPASLHHFHSDWEDYFFVFSKSICLICNVTVALLKKGNLENSAQKLQDD